MKIACPHCRAAFALDDKRVPAAGLSIKCPKCKQPFAVHRAKAGDEGKIIEGKPLIPLPGGPRGGEGDGAAPSQDAPPDDQTMTDQAPVGMRAGAVPLPGSFDAPEGEPEAAPPPAPAHAAAGDDAAIPLPGANEPAEEPPPAAPAPSFADIEAASGWSGVQFADEPAAAPPPPARKAPPPDDDPFANIDIEVPDEHPHAAPAAPAAEIPAPPPPAKRSAPGAAADDPFGLDFPINDTQQSPPLDPAAMAAAPAAPGPGAGLDFDFVKPPPAAAPRAAPPAPDFAEEGKAAPKAARPNRPPPMMAPVGSPAPANDPSVLAADDAAIAALATGDGAASGEAEGGKAKKKKEKKPREKGPPIGEQLARALAPVREKLAELREKPKAIAGGVGILAVLVIVALGVYAGQTSAGIFWKNLWTPAGKQHSAAAREALKHGDEKLADGSFSASREALATAARTLQALPDDEDARAFFVLCASELKVGWGATGGDWDQATHVVEKLKGKDKEEQRAMGAFALGSGDLARARSMLAPLGDAPNADPESVWLYSQTLMRAGEAPHAAQVLDGALKNKPAVKLLLLRGQVERARGKPDEAMKFFEQALALSPNSGRALVEVADGKLKAGDLAGAGALLDRALAPDVHAQLDASEDGHASMLRALLADKQHNGKEAEAQFERAAKLDTAASQTFAAYGAFRLKRREFDKAAKQFDIALQLDAKNPETLGNAARAFIGANRFLDADKRVHEALDKQPKDPRLLFASGKVAEAIGKLDEATREYDRALAVKADLPEALIAEAQLLLAANDKDRARSKIDAAEKAPAADKSAIDYENLTDVWLALGETKLARDDAQQAQALEPEDPYADLAMGRALSALGDLTPARALFEKAIARIDGDPVMHYDLGSLLRREGNLAGARKELEKAVQLDNKDARFHARLGAVMVEQGDFGPADYELHQAVLMDDHSAEGYYFLGRAQIAEKKLSEAIETLKKGIEIDPKNAQIDYQLGLAYAAGAQLGQAMDSFTKATDKDPRHADAWEQLGLAEMQQNLFQDAMASFKKAVALEPERARSWAEIGDAYQQLGDLDKAIENLTKSLKLDQGQAPIWAKLGVAYRDRGCDSCKTRAIASLERAVQLAPKDATPYRELGYIYKDDRKRPEAVASFKRYLELRPDAPDADSVKDDIFYLQEEGKRAP